MNYVLLISTLFILISCTIEEDSYDPLEGLNVEELPEGLTINITTIKVDILPISLGAI